MSYKTKKFLVSTVSVLILTVIVLPLFVSAQGGSGQPNPGGSGQPTGPIVIANPFKANTIQGFIESIVNDILIPIGGVVAVLMIMYAGFLFVTAKGDSKQIDTAKDALLYAVIGAAILLGAWVISKAIGATIDQLRA